jgi:pimeloyl-ACP methyl ester carboxylesterase
LHSYVRDGLTFEVSDDGPAEGRVVIALHGFPEDRHCWSGLTPQLTGAGYRVLAPDQRGYSPGARPKGRRAYAMAELTADILALADVAGADRFDLVGHDWGAAVAWALAARHPDRVRTLTALSVPHPRAMQQAVLRSRQLLRSWYMLAFQIPWVPEATFRVAGVSRGAAQLTAEGLEPESAERYARRLADPGQATPMVNWYRAIPFGAASPIPRVSVPTTLIWGDGDKYLTRYGVEHTAAQVTGPFRLEILPGADHWLPTGAADRVAPLVLDRLAHDGH